MKKILAIILASLMLISFAACDSGSKTEETTDAKSEVSSTVDTEAKTEATTETETETETEAATEATVNTASVSLETVATNLIHKYAEFANIRASYDEFMAEMPEEDKISYEEFLSYQLAVNPCEVGAEWLMAFTNAPTGYAEAYCYQPMMMGQAFIGYIFRVEEGKDVEEFKQFLLENCDPRWNICTMANTTVCENYGDIVYFSMMVVADEEHPDGFTAEQKDAFYTTFVESIENSAN